MDQRIISAFPRPCFRRPGSCTVLLHGRALFSCKRNSRGTNRPIRALVYEKWILIIVTISRTTSVGSEVKSTQKHGIFCLGASCQVLCIPFRIVIDPVFEWYLLYCCDLFRTGFFRCWTGKPSGSPYETSCSLSVLMCVVNSKKRWLLFV